MIETFFSYMNRVLYEKEKGYYCQQKHPASLDGDYITASSHPIFSKAVRNFIKKNLKNQKISFLDFGGGDGSFLLNLKKEIKKNVKFICIEKIKRFDDKDIIFFDSIEKIQKIKGIIFSFELFDSLPFHLIEKDNGRLEEIYVENNKFVKGKLSSNKILEYLKRYKIKLQDNQRIEVCLSSEEIYQKFCNKLVSGFILTFDYGFKSEILYKKSVFSQGTLMTHKNKKMDRNALEMPFKKDITSAVNFSALENIGIKNGFDTIGFLTLSKFLVDNLENNLKNLKNIKHPIPIYDLIFGKVGQDIKALIQKKN